MLMHSSLMHPLPKRMLSRGPHMPLARTPHVAIHALMSRILHMTAQHLRTASEYPSQPAHFPPELGKLTGLLLLRAHEVLVLFAQKRNDCVFGAGSWRGGCDGCRGRGRLLLGRGLRGIWRQDGRGRREGEGLWVLLWCAWVLILVGRARVGGDWWCWRCWSEKRLVRDNGRADDLLVVHWCAEMWWEVVLELLRGEM